jgi:hypothetical protein
MVKWFNSAAPCLDCWSKFFYEAVERLGKPYDMGSIAMSSKRTRKTLRGRIALPLLPNGRFVSGWINECSSSEMKAVRHGEYCYELEAN